MKSYTSRKKKPSIPFTSCGLESQPGQDAEGTYKTYLGGGALPPDGFTNPADPRVQEELTDHFCWRHLGAVYQNSSPLLEFGGYFGVNLGSGIIFHSNVTRCQIRS